MGMRQPCGSAGMDTKKRLRHIRRCLRMKTRMTANAEEGGGASLGLYVCAKRFLFRGGTGLAVCRARPAGSFPGVATRGGREASVSLPCV